MKQSNTTVFALYNGMRFSPLVLFLLPLVLEVVVASECGHALAKVVSPHVVKEDSTKFYDGVLANVWVRQDEAQQARCAYSTYTHKPDGTIQENPVFYNMAGKKVEVPTDFIHKSDNPGIFKFAGDDNQSGKYNGITYLFYADENVIGFYSCEIGGFKWNLSIQVKTKEGLQSPTPTPVKMSLQQAKAIMDLILREGQDMGGLEMVQYPLSNICFS